LPEVFAKLRELQLDGTADLQIRAGTLVPAAGNITNTEAGQETGCGTGVPPSTTWGIGVSWPGHLDSLRSVNSNR